MNFAAAALVQLKAKVPSRSAWPSAAPAASALPRPSAAERSVTGPSLQLAAGSILNSWSAARSCAHGLVDGLLLGIGARRALEADEVVERRRHLDHDGRAVDRDVELDLAVHVGALAAGPMAASGHAARRSRAVSARVGSACVVRIHALRALPGRQPRRVAPLAPAAGIERGRPEPGDLHREQVGHGAHAAAALVDDRGGIPARQQRFELGAQLRGRLELAVGTDVLGEGPVQGPRDVTRDRVERFHLAAITCARRAHRSASGRSARDARPRSWCRRARAGASPARSSTGSARALRDR